jgi:hypothetical protein
MRFSWWPRPCGLIWIHNRISDLNIVLSVTGSNHHWWVFVTSLGYHWLVLLEAFQLGYGICDCVRVGSRADPSAHAHAMSCPCQSLSIDRYTHAFPFDRINWSPNTWRFYPYFELRIRPHLIHIWSTAEQTFSQALHIKSNLLTFKEEWRLQTSISS